MREVLRTAAGTTGEITREHEGELYRDILCSRFSDPRMILS